MRSNAQKVLHRMSLWHGEMSEESVGATLFSVWHYHFLSSLFSDYIKDDDIKLSFVANYPFIDFYQRLIHGLSIDPKIQKYNKICKGYYEEYKGEEHCIYNMVRAMADTYSWLSARVS